MTFEEAVDKAARGHSIHHPDDIEFLRQDMRLGWNAAMESLGGTSGMTPDQVRVVKLRTRWSMLEEVVEALRITASREKRSEAAAAYAVVLNRIHYTMRELGLDYPN